MNAAPIDPKNTEQGEPIRLRSRVVSGPFSELFEGYDETNREWVLIKRLRPHAATDLHCSETLLYESKFFKRCPSGHFGKLKRVAWKAGALLLIFEYEKLTPLLNCALNLSTLNGVEAEQRLSTWFEDALKILTHFEQSSQLVGFEPEQLLVRQDGGLVLFDLGFLALTETSQELTLEETRERLRNHLWRVLCHSHTEESGGVSRELLRRLRDVVVGLGEQRAASTLLQWSAPEPKSSLAPAAMQNGEGSNQARRFFRKMNLHRAIIDIAAFAIPLTVLPLIVFWAGQAESDRSTVNSPSPHAATEVSASGRERTGALKPEEVFEFADLPKVSQEDAQSVEAQGQPEKSSALGRLSIRSNVPVQVFINGELRGKTPLPSLSLEPGTWKVQLRHRDGRTITQSVLVEDEEQPQINVVWR